MLTIAVCEDNPITSEEICQKIKQYSPMEAQIFSFSDDSDILAAVRERQFEPHIVFMDIELQGSSGIQTAKNITSLLPDCQIIYITNYVDYASQVYESSHIYFILKSQTDTYLPKALHAWRNLAVFISPSSLEKPPREFRRRTSFTWNGYCGTRRSIREKPFTERRKN